MTVPSINFEANLFGLYNLSGNVAEWIDEDLAVGGHFSSTGYDVRIESTIRAETSAYIGLRILIEIQN